MNAKTGALMTRPWMKCLLTVVGSILMAAGYNLFFIPNEIAPGGMTGVAQIVHALTGLPIGALVAALNIPLLILGRRMRGRSFMLRTILAIAITSLLIDVIRFPDALYSLFEGELLLATIYGGIVVGAGIGLAIMGDSTTGGSDLAAMIIHTRWPHFRVAWVLYAIDGIVVLSSMFIFGPIMGLYALVALFLSSKVIDLMQTGIYAAKAMYIISDKTDIIKAYVLNDIGRGATLLKAAGAFSGKDTNVLLCIVSNREIRPIRNQVREVDPNAFVIISDVKEVEGEGFTR